MTSRSRAFTLTEILLVIAILAILIGLIIVSMRGARNAANRTESTNALRQMMGGYLGYASDNRQALMPGFLGKGLIGPSLMFDLRPRTPHGEYWNTSDPVQSADLSSYVWRLSPYLDNEWKTMMVDYRNTSLVNDLQLQVLPPVGSGPPRFGPGTGEEFGVARVPSFGLNSIFVGGDSSHGGDSVTDNHPFQANFTGKRLAAQRMSEVRNPAMLIVFGPAAEASSAAPPGEAEPYRDKMRNSWRGYPELRAPFTVAGGGLNDWTNWSQRQWEIGQRGQIVKSSTVADGFAGGDAHYGLGGLPIIRWGTTQFPAGLLDGSTAVEDIREIANDMRRWSPFVTGMQPVF